LEIVRLINRMAKERHFKVHPNVLSCLLHLRLRTELGVRASNTHADKPGPNKGKKQSGKKSEPIHLSKKAKKALKEQKEIDKELREAGAEVDKEERKTVVCILTIYCLFSFSQATAKNTANGDPEAALCLILPYPKKPNAHALAPLGTLWNL
jgi:nucleolar complex protein 3